MERLELQLLGFPAFRLNGRPIDLSLRKAAALIIYLAEAAAPVGRDVVATLLWPESDEETARARLRRTLHKIRVAFGSTVIAAHGSALSLLPTLEVDSHNLERAHRFGQLGEVAELYRQDYLEGFSVPNCAEFEEWVFFRRETLRSQLIQALERLVETKIAEGAPRAAVGYGMRLAALDPLSETAHRYLIRAHLATGDRVAAKRQTETCVRLLRDELGTAPDSALLALLDKPAGGATSEAPRTRYVGVNGVHIAYQVVGSGATDIVVVPGFVSHVERIWEDARCRAWISTVSRMGRLIIFDRRGMGLSDRIGASPTAEATAQDILAVMTAVGSRQTVLIGASEAGLGCIRFAADHPSRLTGLILWGALARGCRAPGYPGVLSATQFDLWKRRLLSNWGGAAEIETFAPSLAGDRQVRAWWAGLLRAASSPGAMARLLDALRDADVRHLLPKISTPTVVLHRSGDRAVRLEAGRFVGAKIPSARFMEIEGDDHWFWAGNQQPLLDAIKTLLGGPHVGVPP